MTGELEIQVRPDLPCGCPKGMAWHAMNCPDFPNELQMPPKPETIRAIEDFNKAAREFLEALAVAIKPSIEAMNRLAAVMFAIVKKQRPIAWRRSWKNGKPK